VFALFYERRHNVVMTCISGVFSSEDIEQHDRAVLNFLAGLFVSEQKVRGLYDLSGVEVLAVPVSKINQRGQRPAIIEGMRVVVAPPAAAAMDFAGPLSNQLRMAGHREPIIVETLAEAYRLLGIENPSFDRIA